MKKIESVKGMNDLVPADSGAWQYLEATIADVASGYGYNEIRFPILEQTELFKRSIGEVTDIVEKEMYTFDDRNGLSLTLRPEGTASCVRACEQNGLLYNQTQKLWYMGPMFRYEKPQKGRLRQFHQVGLETFGMPGPDVDAELLLLTSRLWKQLGVADAVTLQINSLGDAGGRRAYRDALVSFLSARKTELDEDSKRRLESNPLRILDSKNAKTQTLLNDAPVLADYISEQSKAHFEALLMLLDSAGVKYEINPRLVRGLDYYSNTVFEWVTDKLGAQGTVCAGGRYDGLVEQLGGKPTQAIGCAMGLERLLLLLETLDVIPPAVNDSLDVYMLVESGMQAQALAIAEQVREAQPTLRLYTHTASGSLKNQMKRADKSGAAVAIIVAGQETERGEVSIKPLRERIEQTTVPVAEVSGVLKQFI